MTSSDFYEEIDDGGSVGAGHPRHYRPTPGKRPWIMGLPKIVGRCPRCASREDHGCEGFLTDVRQVRQRYMNVIAMLVGLALCGYCEQPIERCNCRDGDAEIAEKVAAIDAEKGVQLEFLLWFPGYLGHKHYGTTTTEGARLYAHWNTIAWKAMELNQWSLLPYLSRMRPFDPLAVYAHGAQAGNMISG